MAEFLDMVMRGLIMEMFEKMEFPLEKLSEFERIIPQYITSFNKEGVNENLRQCLAALVHIRTFVGSPGKMAIDLAKEVNAILTPPPKEVAEPSQELPVDAKEPPKVESKESKVEKSLVEATTTIHVWETSKVTVEFVAPWSIVFTIHDGHEGDTTRVYTPAKQVDWLTHGTTFNLDCGCRKGIDICTGSDWTVVNGVTLLLANEASLNTTREAYIKAFNAHEAFEKEEEEANRSNQNLLEVLHGDEIPRKECDEADEVEPTDEEILKAVDEDRAYEAKIMAEALSYMDSLD